MKKLFIFVIVILAVLRVDVDAGNRSKRQTAVPTIPDETTPVMAKSFTPVSQPSSPARTASLGTYTTLSGFYDYQANGTPQLIRVNPANGNIHVTYMMAEDSTQPSASRRTAYAMSSNGGVTWNNFNNVRVPARRSGFPSIDLMQGSVAGSPVIGNHTTITGTQSTIFVDSPEGTGAFSELNSPPLIDAAATDEPIWPFVAGPADGSIVVHSSRSTAGTNHLNRTVDFSSWLYPSPWFLFTGPNGSGGRNPTMATTTGRVGTLVNAVNPTPANPADGGLYLYESTNNGATWNSPITVHPAIRTVGTDTFGVWVSSDLTYDGETPLVALNTATFDLATGGYFYATAKIDFWSQATGLVTAVAHDTTLFVSDMNGFAQSNHLTLGGPTICKSGNKIVIVFQAFGLDTSSTGLRYSDIWYVVSSNNGARWSAPTNLTHSPGLDERYPSVSKWNQAGSVNMVWQEDPYPGSWTIATPDPGALPGRAREVYYKLLLTGVDESGAVASGYKLEQNYPNPFNPGTKIGYSISKGSDVKLTVYNVLGQEVATLVDEYRTAGNYEASFSVKNLASGVYYYTLRAGNFTATKKMILMK